MWSADAIAARQNCDSFDESAETRARRARVARWVAADAVPVDPRIHRGPMLEEQSVLGELVGLDADDRPVLSVLRPGTETECSFGFWTWDGDGFEEAEMRGGLPAVRRFGMADGRVTHCVEAELGRLSVALIRWDGDRPVRRDRVIVNPGGWCLATTRTARYDEGGLLEMRSGDEQLSEGNGDTELSTDELLPVIEEGLRVASNLATDYVVWQAKAHRPAALPTDPGALVEPLAVALDAAIVAAVHEAAKLEPFCVEVRAGPDAPMPPFIRIGGRAFRDCMRAASMRGVAIDDLHLGVSSGDVRFDDLVERLDDAAHAACRSLSALADGDRLAASQVLATIGDRLAALLNARSWSAVADPFLALVALDPHGRDDDGMVRAVASTSVAYVERFNVSLQPTAVRPERAELQRLASAALTDRDALADLLGAHGLSRAAAQRIAHDVAQVGLHLDTAREACISRLGGPPLLGPGMDWPHTSDGDPLSFLAAIDLAEARAAGGDERLPDAGMLLFFGVVDPNGEGLWEPEVNAEGASVRVLFVAPDAATLQTKAPQQTFALRQRAVAPTPVLTLPDSHDTEQQLELDVYELQSFHEAVEWLDRGDESAEHWIGGLVSGVQGDPPDPDTILLLHLSSDDDLGLELMDAGTLQFRIPLAALDNRDWSSVVAQPDSS